MPMTNEARAIRRQERAFAPEGNDEDTTDAVSDGENDPADLEADKDVRLFCAYMAELQQEDLEWKGKLGRPNSKNMSLHFRSLQNADHTALVVVASPLLACDPSQH